MPVSAPVFIQNQVIQCNNLHIFTSSNVSTRSLRNRDHKTGLVLGMVCDRIPVVNKLSVVIIKVNII